MNKIITIPLGVAILCCVQSVDASKERDVKKFYTTASQLQSNYITAQDRVQKLQIALDQSRIRNMELSREVSKLREEKTQLQNELSDVRESLERAEQDKAYLTQHIKDVIGKKEIEEKPLLEIQREVLQQEKDKKKSPNSVKPEGLPTHTISFK